MKRKQLWIIAFVVISSLSVRSATAAFVMPMIGGGQVGMVGAPMKHADITFDGTSVGVHVDNSVATPLLRPLTEPDEFDPGQPWSVLQNKAYNFQFGWNAGGFITLPPSTGIWIEQLSATPGLEVYQRPPASPSYAPIFETAGSSSIWNWSGAMTHNVYAILNPTETSYFAEYKVYIGDATTGAEILGEGDVPMYGSQTVSFHFDATPIPEPSSVVLALIATSSVASLRRRRRRHALR